MNDFTNAHAYELDSIHPLDRELLSRLGCSFLQLTNGSLLLRLPHDIRSVVDQDRSYAGNDQRTVVIYKSRHILLPSGMEVVVCATENCSTDKTEPQQMGTVTVFIPSRKDCYFVAARQYQKEEWYDFYEQVRRGFDQLMDRTIPIDYPTDSLSAAH